ncbi:MAG: hypothetical protein GQ569_01715 [Methylococcaceae bacterium]|nr:hypothetical protein [Methylococcaceae bacterium]
MRRYYRPAFLILLIVALLAWYLPYLWDDSQEYLEKLKSEQDLSSSKAATRIVYPLNNKDWIAFPIPEGSNKVRMISNAHIAKIKHIPPDSIWRYSLNYQLLAADGSLLEENVYHQRTRLTVYKNVKKGRNFSNFYPNDKEESYYANFYASDKDIVLDGRVIHLSLHTIKKVASIRVRLNDFQADIKGVAVRVYAPVKISSHRVKKLWGRLSLDEKEALAKGSVFPASLLSEYEKINLLKNQWQPLGPLGIETKDYESKTLYTLKNISEDKVEPLVLLAGLQADASHPAIIPIPEQGGLTSLELKTLDGSPMPKNIPINLRWFGRTRDEHWQKKATWQADKTLSLAVQGGLLEIRPLAPVVIKATLKVETGEELNITPEALRIKSFFVDAGVDFKIVHLGGKSAPIRVDIRRFFNPEIPLSPSSNLEYQWLDAQRNIVSKGVLKLTNPPSFYDRLKSITEPEKISDPERYYWKLPENVHYLRFKSSQKDIVVNAYNQPLGIIKHSKIPEDSYINLDKEAWLPSWFPLHPLNIEELAIQQRLLWVSGQYHPPEMTDNLLVEAYLWNEHLPEKPYQAHYLLSSYDKENVRDEALRNLYCELPKLKGFSLKLQTPNKLRNLSADLWFFNTDERARNLRVRVDGKLLLKRAVMGQQIKVPLPNITAGKHRFNLSPHQSGRWLLNNTPDCAGNRYLKRRVFKLKSRLKFMYEHQGEDAVLSARLYTPQSNTERTQIKVQIKAINPQNSEPKTITNRWTFKRRIYDIRATASGEESLLLYASKRLNAGESFFIPFNNDLAAGLYQVIISSESKTDAYLSAAQIVAGAYELRRFYREVQFEK